MSNNPLGEHTNYASEYDPTLLFAVARAETRRSSGIEMPLPFDGHDTWNAWELTWLGPRGKPVVATARLRVPATSPNIIESKSLKLYLNSLAMMRYASAADVRDLIAGDLSAVAGATVTVSLDESAVRNAGTCAILAGTCIDDLDVACDSGAVDPSLLTCGDDAVPLTELHSHLLRSNCPVTNQPDSGSILVRYSGMEIEPASLLQYIVSYRRHNGFHETCVENIFVDIMQRCVPTQLTVYARYIRRGGLDINPFRSNFEDTDDDARLWRQ